jgi:tetratricopeptide (TPR) repeat protein
VLGLYKKLKGPDHHDVGMAANNLGMLYHAQNELNLAEEYYLQAIRIRTKVLGRSSPVVQTLFANYVNLLRAMNRTSEADAFKLWSTSSHSDIRRNSLEVV